MNDEDKAKKNRLFVYGDGPTDGVWWYCGGPDPEDAARGLANILAASIHELMATGNNDAMEDISFKVLSLTDAEVKALPDCP